LVIFPLESIRSQDTEHVGDRDGREVIGVTDPQWRSMVVVPSVLRVSVLSSTEATFVSELA
jgi:hypothetical protein